MLCQQVTNKCNPRMQTEFRVMQDYPRVDSCAMPNGRLGVRKRVEFLNNGDEHLRKSGILPYLLDYIAKCRRSRVNHLAYALDG